MLSAELASDRESRAASARQYELQIELSVLNRNMLTAVYGDDSQDAMMLYQRHMEEFNPNQLSGGKSFLFHAIERRSYNVVRFLVDLPRINVDERGTDGATPFHVCACNGELSMARLLLQHGAGIDAQDWNGWTPLYCAALNGTVELVRFLLTHGSQVSIPTRILTPIS
jgi:ankyrin repeat protein